MSWSWSWPWSCSSWWREIQLTLKWFELEWMSLPLNEQERMLQGFWVGFITALLAVLVGLTVAMLIDLAGRAINHFWNHLGSLGADSVVSYGCCGRNVRMQVSGGTFGVGSSETLSVVGRGVVLTLPDGRTMTPAEGDNLQIQMQLGPRQALNVSVSANSIGSITCGSGDVLVRSGCAISSSITTASGDVTVEGDVHGNVQSGSGDIAITGNVQGNVKTASGDVQANTIAGSCSTVSGDIEYN